MAELSYLPARQISVDGQAILERISEIMHCIQIGHVPVYDVPAPGVGLRKAATGPRPVVVSWKPMEPGDLARYQALLNQLSKQLNKAIPDLKAIEVTNTGPKQVIDHEKLAQRIAGVLEVARLEAKKDE